jgi:uncharacterized membrane protein YgdD (TMEM256/DUF423 family)
MFGSAFVSLSHLPTFSPAIWIGPSHVGGYEALSIYKMGSKLFFMTNTWPIRVAALAGVLAVALGAFGAHGLKDVLACNGTAAIWEKAVFYHFIHAVMLFVLATRPTLVRVAWFSFLVGVALFSGSLYVLAVTNIRWLGAITPFGGVSFMVGWVCLLISAGKLKN